MNANPYNLTPAQVKALQAIGQIGGRGFGEYSNGLRRPTVLILKSKGLVWTSVQRGSCSGRLIDWASCTVAGVAELDRIKAERDAETAALLESSR